MFCEKCGKENPAGVSFCDGCGAPLNAAPAAEKAKGKFPIAKILKIAIPVVVVAIVAVLVINLFGGNAYEKTVEKYLNAISNGDGEALKEVVCDEYYQDYLTRKAKDGKPGLGLDEDYIDLAFRSVAMTYADSYYGLNKDIKYSVSTEYLREFEDKEVEEIADFLESYEEDGYKIKYGYEADAIDDVVVFTYRIDSVSRENGYNKPDNSFDTAVLIKVNGDWFVSPLLSEDTIDNTILD